MGKFLRRHESVYDMFGAGHAGTSISAATGIAEAIRRRGGKEKVVAVIGDGALTAGMAYEGPQQRGLPAALEPGRRAQRQRDVDLEERRRAHLVPGAALVCAADAPAEARGEGLPRVDPARRRRAGRDGPPRRAELQGVHLARAALRGARLQLHRPDRRTQPDRARRDAAQRARHRGQRAPAPGPLPHREGLRLRVLAGRPDQVPRCRAVRGQLRRDEEVERRRSRPGPGSSPMR